MPRWVLAVAVSVGLVLLASCSTGEPAGPSGTSASPTLTGAPPRLGGAAPTRHAPPSHAMNPWERQVSEQLDRQLSEDGLHVDFLDCPPWDRRVPATMLCRGYVDGLVGDVRLAVEEDEEVDTPAFAARLVTPVLSTEMLEGRLRTQGWSDPDCGAAPAYRARVGSEIVCRVLRSGRARYLVATVADPDGEVVIADYRQSGTG